MNDEGIDWLEWFHDNADFGPADGDVRLTIAKQYEEETGKPCPWRKDDE